MSIHRPAPLSTPLWGGLLAAVLLLGLCDSTAGQSRRSRGSRSTSADASLPGQRTPLPKSELNLAAVPYRIVYESLLGGRRRVQLGNRHGGRRWLEQGESHEHS